MAKKQAATEIAVTDLAVAVQIIDLASEKGLFKGGDLKPVGEVRERLVNYIKENAPAPAEAPANETIN
jgi:hypothetical protein